MRSVAAYGVLRRPSSKDAIRPKNGALRRPGVSPGFESPLRRDISGREARQKERRVNDETQQRVVTAVAAGITFALSRLVTQRFIRIPERRGIKDDVLEAVLKGSTTAVSTVLASVIVRRLLRGGR